MADNNDLLNVIRYGWDQLEQEEDATDGAGVNAGYLVEPTASGYQPHSTDAGVVHRPVFAKDMRGRGYEVDDNYPDGEWISFVVPNGAVGLTGVLAAGSDLATASNATVDGDTETPLVSAGDGTLRAYEGTDDADAVVAVAKETKDNSGAASGETVLLDIEVTN